MEIQYLILLIISLFAVLIIFYAFIKDKIYSKKWFLVSLIMGIVLLLCSFLLSLSTAASCHRVSHPVKLLLLDSLNSEPIILIFPFLGFLFTVFSFSFFINHKRNLIRILAGIIFLIIALPPFLVIPYLVAFSCD